MLRSNIVRNKTIFVNIMSNSEPAIFKIYTDGGCLNNGKKNAICSIGIHFPKRNLYPIIDVSRVLDVQKSSNNVAELTAIQEALKIYSKENIKIPLNIYSDSKYSMNCITQWYPNWKKKGIVETKKNHELITDIVNLYQEMNKGLQINFKYIEAHTGKIDEDSIGNSIADQLASQALKGYSNKFEQFGNLKTKPTKDLKSKPTKDSKSKPGDISKYFS